MSLHTAYITAYYSAMKTQELINAIYPLSHQQYRTVSPENAKLVDDHLALLSEAAGLRYKLSALVFATYKKEITDGNE